MFDIWNTVLSPNSHPSTKEVCDHSNTDQGPNLHLSLNWQFTKRAQDENISLVLKICPSYVFHSAGGMSMLSFVSKSTCAHATAPVRNLFPFPMAVISSSETTLFRPKVLLFPILAKLPISVPLPNLLSLPIAVSAGSWVPYPKVLLFPIFTGEECLWNLHQLPNLWSFQICDTSSNVILSPKSHGHKICVLSPLMIAIWYFCPCFDSTIY